MRKFSCRAAAGALLVLALLAAAADTVTVKVQSSAIRQNPQFFAPVVAAVRAGDKLVKLAEAGGWLQVKSAAGASGWIHAGAVATSRLNLASSGTGLKTQASASEVALAGKGFNKQVEDSYKSKNPKLDFAAVD
ncbi:MAG: SH3 domain-containing protein, partial [Acidobacteriota bacterium]|nr:SH3 domain-containing protein [Acidobacteriota bacterium]